MRGVASDSFYLRIKTAVISSLKKNIKTNLKPLIFVLLAALLCLPMVVEYFVMLCDKSYYWHAVGLIPVIAVIFIVRWKRAQPADRYPPRWPVWVLVLMSLPVMFFALLYYIPWLAMLVWLMFLLLGAMHLSSFRKVDNFLGICLLLLLLLRPPYQMVLRGLYWMESLSAKPASMILDYDNVIHTIQGGIISLNQKEFVLHEICSGFVSILSTIAVAAVICVLRNRTLLHSIAVLFLAVICAWALNVARILVVVQMSVQHDVDLLSGPYEIVFVTCSFLISVALILCADSLSAFVLADLRTDDPNARGIRYRKTWLAKTWNALGDFKLANILGSFSLLRRTRGTSLLGWIMLYVFLSGLIALEAVVLYHRPLITGTSFMHGTEGELTKIKRQSVLFDRPGWQITDYVEEKRDFDSIWGALSSTWRLKYNGISVVMSLDYPFHDWHDVKSCYSNIGWKLTSEQTLNQGDFVQWGISESNFMLPNGDVGFVLCSHCDQIGAPVQPKPVSHRWDMLRYRLDPSRWTAPFGASMDSDRQTFYQTQSMVTTPVPLDEATKQEIRLMYASFREQVRRAIATRSQ